MGFAVMALLVAYGENGFIRGALVSVHSGPGFLHFPVMGAAVMSALANLATR